MKLMLTIMWPFGHTHRHNDDVNNDTIIPNNEGTGDENVEGHILK